MKRWGVAINPGQNPPVIRIVGPFNGLRHRNLWLRHMEGSNWYCVPTDIDRPLPAETLADELIKAGKVT